jgi:cytochrome c peroxidase
MGDKNALSDAEKRGLILFIGKAACSECHNGPNFTDNKYHNLGIAAAQGNPDDVGRFTVTKNPEDRNAFKTPTLRNVALTAPYMHDGSSATLEEVIELYDRGGGDAPGKSKLIYKLDLTPQEKADLVAFMKSLNGTMPQMKAPAMYPEADVHSKGELGRQ